MGIPPAVVSCPGEAGDFYGTFSSPFLILSSALLKTPECLVTQVDAETISASGQ